MKEKKRIVIVGNGFGGTYALKELHRIFHNHDKVTFTLIGEKNYFLFTPLLHEVATGGISPENIIEPIRKILGCCLENFYLGKVQKVNTISKTVQTEHDTIPYDYLIMAQGSETNFFNIPGAQENSFTLKSLSDATEIKNHLISQIEKASHLENDMARKKALCFVIVGGGPTGVELSAEVKELIVHTFSKYYNRHLIQDTSVYLIQRDPTLLPQFGPKIRQKSIEVLSRKGIKVLLETEVKEVSMGKVILSGNKSIESETIIWVAGIKPRKIEFDTHTEELPDGRILINNFLQSKTHKDIFAIGDVSALEIGERRYLPALAQVAEKQAKAVSKNIALSIKNKPMQPFNYQSSGSLVSLGQWMAAGEISSFTFYGHMAWWLWRTVYLSKMISFRKKLRVAMDWTINLFSPRDISQI